MKTILKFAVITFILSAGNLFAQEWSSLNPEMTQILADTNLVKAYVAVIEPGKKSLVHTHSASFFYALTDCKLKVYYTDGQVETLDIKAGEGGYGNPEKPHQTENVGDKTAKFLLVELKEHPYSTSSNK
jgi:mannose-6-phosphate isomerase-like protein (cupin superfamily)